MSRCFPLENLQQFIHTSLVNLVALDRQKFEILLVQKSFQDDTKLETVKAIVVKVQLLYDILVDLHVRLKTFRLACRDLHVPYQEDLVYDLVDDRDDQRVILDALLQVLHFGMGLRLYILRRLGILR